MLFGPYLGTVFSVFGYGFFRIWVRFFPFLGTVFSVFGYGLDRTWVRFFPYLDRTWVRDPSTDHPPLCYAVLCDVAHGGIWFIARFVRRAIPVRTRVRTRRAVFTRCTDLLRLEGRLERCMPGPKQAT